MSLRTIMLFPEFDNAGIIDDIRAQYDPLSELVRPHITLVFPFDLQMPNEQLKVFLDNRLKDTQPFTIQLSQISKHINRHGNYLFLNVSKGSEKISEIYDTLHTDELEKLNMGRPYIPHMTIGKLETPELLNEAYEHIKTVTDTFTTEVNKISVEMIGANDESIIIIEINLKTKQSSNENLQCSNT